MSGAEKSAEAYSDDVVSPLLAEWLGELANVRTYLGTQDDPLAARHASALDRLRGEMTQIISGRGDDALIEPDDQPNYRGSRAIFPPPNPRTSWD